MPRVAHHLAPFHWEDSHTSSRVSRSIEWRVQQAAVLAVDCVNVCFRIVPVDVSLCQMLFKFYIQFSATSETCWPCWRLLFEVRNHLLEVCKPYRCLDSSLCHGKINRCASSWSCVTPERELEQLTKSVGQYQLFLVVDSNSLEVNGLLMVWNRSSWRQVHICHTNKWNFLGKRNYWNREMFVANFSLLHSSPVWAKIKGISL